MNVEDVRFKAKIKEVDGLIDVARIDFVNKEVSIELEQIVGFGHYWFEDVEEILPYTGFKDQNGEPIYEGDILKVISNDYFKNNTKEHPYPCVVMPEYEVGRGCCGKSMPNGWIARNNNYKDKKPYRHSIILISIWQDSEIIGNKFENLELLKKV